MILKCLLNCRPTSSWKHSKIFKILPRNLLTSEKQKEFPTRCDILIVGGGVIGSSVAYHLKEKVGDKLSIVLVEADDTYRAASSALSMGCIRQQFTVPENIYLSRYGMEFLEKSHHLLKVPGLDPTDVQFHPRGFLMLASEASRGQLLENFKIQIDAGAKVELLSTEAEIKSRFPWMNTEGITAGVIGTANEGWFDPWSLLMGLRQKALSLGTHYIRGEFTGITIKENTTTTNLNIACLNLKRDKEDVLHEIEFATLVLATGHQSGKIGKLAGIGKGKGILSLPIPVEPRKRFVYCVHVPNGPGRDCPIFCDNTGAHFRPEATPNIYLCIKAPTQEEEPHTCNLNVDYEYFEKEIWPRLAKRIPSFENLKLRQAWAGFYDYNTFDQNAILGRHPALKNIVLATGFSGHGIQHAPGAGRAVMEYILYGRYLTINLERFGFERIINEKPLYEKNIL
ncbi:FAD-dependent oxidoreductase domain-containing protein 1 [Halocaridina rubra]|uniref:FAD-dependent oxidoreductase domain-containing protein 1 n=1 Tax=Halocaridina rubra TaxID=373956 RepID=A0AAN8WZW5_HALRR